MKAHRLRSLLALLAAAAVTTSFVACEKPDKKTTEKPAQPQNPPGDSSVQPEKTDPSPALPAADISAIRAAYGFASRIPKDVEAFSASYRLHDLWQKFSTSKWAAAFLNLPMVKDSPEFKTMLEQWKSAPQAPMVKNLLEALFGTEFATVMPAGFTDKMMPVVDMIAEMQAVNMQRMFMTAIGGGKQPDSTKLLREAAPDLIPALVKCDIPPVFFVFKAVKAKADIDGALGQMVKQMTTQAPPGIEVGQFKLADKYDFQNITVTARKLIAAFDEARLRIQMKEMLGDEKTAKEAMDGLLSKRAEIAWGWVDEYLVVSLGVDHSHVKFASGDGDSALSIPAVARRAAQFLEKRPIALGYGNATMFERLEGPMEFAKDFDALTEELQGLIKPDQIAAMKGDVKRLEGKAQAVFKSQFDPMVSVGFWEGGLRTEMFGGARQTFLDSSKPLAFAGLFTPSVMIFGDGRRNPATTGKLADFLEDVSSTVFGWYEKFGRTMIPESERQGAATMETIAIPMVKEFWQACRQLSRALGDESAFILDLDGMMPKMPDIPPGMSEGKIARLAWVWELKDRAGVSEAWKKFDRVIKQLTALAGSSAGPGAPEPQMRTEDNVEMHFVPLPVPTGDLLPHIAITKDRWMVSTSPSFSKAIASKSAASGGTPIGTEWRIQFPALCDFADGWMKLIDKDPKSLLGSASDAQKYQKMRPLLGGVMELMRSVRALEMRVFEEGGQTRNSTFLKLEDLK